MFQRLRRGHIFLGVSFQPTTHDKCKKKEETHMQSHQNENAEKQIKKKRATTE